MFIGVQAKYLKSLKLFKQCSKIFRSYTCNLSYQISNLYMHTLSILNEVRFKKVMGILHVFDI